MPSELVASESKTSIGDVALPHIVFLGAGFGGLTCARTLRGALAMMTVINRSNELSIFGIGSTIVPTFTLTN